MNSTIWMALALVLILEGAGPMLMPRLWRRMILSLTQLPDRLLHRFGGGLVVAGVVIYCLFSQHMQG
ncbi:MULTISPECIES: DUF2065 domain-containing protein [Pantoea]|jgi:uncharacterized protein YjeT (DUF2065 family)|uniref:DUF2065 family protein n=1 Tax=Pantoea eucrina TaxID=472693 RepID=A0ABS1ZAA4_9GAMM|nr:MULTISPECIES: DUF2065 family protein [Pantoea]AIX49454.1 membrane protein [Pantoea sp. PSNIH1]MBM0748908.1 DUF2065 family protein [Pantoea eucrina]MCL9647096.1 DUF2065 family protein [Pantoea eucrina]MDJ0025424.1 DUF2065 family protein [Pantoea eucrina]NIE71006.1 DUF2065 family protein [Pantoea sp. Acro-807]